MKSFKTTRKEEKMPEKKQVIVKCPQCGKGYRVTTGASGKSRCGLCGYAGPASEFLKLKE